VDGGGRHSRVLTLAGVRAALRGAVRVDGGAGARAHAGPLLQPDGDPREQAGAGRRVVRAGAGAARGRRLPGARVSVVGAARGDDPGPVAGLSARARRRHGLR